MWSRVRQVFIWGVVWCGFYSLSEMREVMQGSGLVQRLQFKQDEENIYTEGRFVVGCQSLSLRRRRVFLWVGQLVRSWSMRKVFLWERRFGVEWSEEGVYVCGQFDVGVSLSSVERIIIRDMVCYGFLELVCVCSCVFYVENYNLNRMKRVFIYVSSLVWVVGV